MFGWTDDIPLPFTHSGADEWIWTSPDFEDHGYHSPGKRKKSPYCLTLSTPASRTSLGNLGSASHMISWHCMMYVLACLSLRLSAQSHVKQTSPNEHFWLFKPLLGTIQNLQYKLFGRERVKNRHCLILSETIIFSFSFIIWTSKIIFVQSCQILPSG